MTGRYAGCRVLVVGVSPEVDAEDAQALAAQFHESGITALVVPGLTYAVEVDVPETEADA